MKYTIEQLIELKPIGSTLTPIGFCGHLKYKGGTCRLIKCRCFCGNFKDVILLQYLNGKNKHCSIYCKLNLKRKHGLSGKNFHKLYRLWNGIKQRCKTDRYIKKGIVMCEEWKNDFISFYNWSINNGWYDSNNKSCQIDRINNNGNYEPLNCRFTTPMVNARNKDNSIYITHNGMTLHINEWVKLLGIHRNTIKRRLDYGWDVKDVLSTEKHNRSKKITHEQLLIDI